MLSQSKMKLAPLMKEYLQLLNDKYTKKCLEQKKRSIVYEPIKQFGK